MAMETHNPSAATRPKDLGRDAALLDGQRRVLELLARGAPLRETLTALCEAIEERSPAARSSVHLVDARAKVLRHGAAPRLPEAYSQAIDGAPFGPAQGSCGTAAFLAEDVVVEDIANSPLWAGYRELALTHRLHACASIPIFDGRRNVLGTFAIYHDLAGPFHVAELALLREMSGLATLAIEGHRRDAALRESEERFRLVSEQTGHVIYDVDVVTGKTVWAGALEALCGATSTELQEVGLEGFAERIHPEDRERIRAAHRTARDGASGMPARAVATNLEYRVRHADGSIRTLVERGASLTDDTGLVVRHFGVLADVSERRRTQEALRQTQKLDSLGVLAGGIAHDFNNLFTAMLGNVNLAEIHAGKNSPALTYLKSLEAAVLRAADLAKQMLAYSGKGHFVITPASLSNVVTDMTKLLAAGVPKNVTFEAKLAGDLPLIEADIAQLQQLVVILVTNAAEAIGIYDGTVTVTTEARDFDGAEVARAFGPQRDQRGRFVMLEVTDTGSGMPTEIIDKIFDPFFTTKRRGRGLGLSALLGILRGHNAGVEVTSEVGFGTTFRLLFEPRASTEAPPPEAKSTPSSNPSSRGLALVVDDESEIRRTMGLMLMELGLEVIEAGNGVEAVERVRARGDDISIIVMDLTMPKMSGKEAFRAIRELGAKMPVVLCSGYSEQDAIEGFEGLGLAGFLQKPYQFKDLSDVVHRALASGE